MAKRKEKPQPKPELGTLGLVIAVVLLMAVGLFLKDARGFPYKALGALIWGGALGAAFFFAMIFYGQFVLPLRDNEGWTEGWQLLIRHYFAPFQGTAHLSRKPRPRDHGPLPGSFRHLRAGLIPSFQVLSVAKGTGYSRPLGPGFVMLYRGEFVESVIDLRRHLRTQRVKAITRDGIQIETTVSAVFRVRQTAVPDPNNLLPHPYDNEAIFHVSYANSIAARDKVRGWTERVTPKLAGFFTAELGRLSLNELYEINEPGLHPITDLKQKLKNMLADAVEPEGIEILAVGISQLSLPDMVREQRVKTWQADWKRKINQQKAVGNAEAMRRIKKARARAQIEIIENITQNISAVRRTEETDLTQIITLRMIEVLEEAMTSDVFAPLLPQQVLTHLVQKTAHQLQASIGQSQ